MPTISAASFLWCIADSRAVVSRVMNADIVIVASQNVRNVSESSLNAGGGGRQ